ncbi:hypothetical protein E2C01_039573 [Portunus trituberculatus]|uniref:Uncharacterized protein n=1 Tax=Portunus trituberculatus TaxID=210409 RepID=A0A5B7FK51_PORTR|nr:hypothetical protein [Portunus trituberculatus]
MDNERDGCFHRHQPGAQQGKGCEISFSVLLPQFCQSGHDIISNMTFLATTTKTTTTNTTTTTTTTTTVITPTTTMRTPLNDHRPPARPERFKFECTSYLSPSLLPSFPPLPPPSRWYQDALQFVYTAV